MSEVGGPFVQKCWIFTNRTANLGCIMGNNLSAFLGKVQGDAELQARLGAVSVLPVNERREGFLALAAEVGTPVSPGDLEEYAKRGELSEALLEDVTGGGGNFRTITRSVSPADPNAGNSVKEFLSHFGINL